MLNRRRPPSIYYKSTCAHCQLIVAVCERTAAVRSHPPLRPLYRVQSCPLCQHSVIQEREILREEYQRIEHNWDLLAAGEDVSLESANGFCSLEEISEIDLSAL